VATPEQWPKIKEIVGAALEREPSERSAFLDEACSQHGELRAEVESLLAAYADADGLSEYPWTTTVGEAARESKTIGPYRLIRELGVGGMGQVWLAEQTEPVRRRIALKLIKAGMFEAAVVKRFQAERQSLAIMDHPAIAKVFDAGATPTGQPYFAMEYVDGLPMHRLLRQEEAGDSRSSEAVSPSLRRSTTRAPESHYSPRPEALQYFGGRSRREADSAHHRLWPGENDIQNSAWRNVFHTSGCIPRHARIHEC